MKKFMIAFALFCSISSTATAQHNPLTFNECDGDDIMATFDSATSTITLTLRNDQLGRFDTLKAMTTGSIHIHWYATEPKPETGILHGTTNNAFNNTAWKTVGAEIGWNYGRDDIALVTTSLRVPIKGLKVVPQKNGSVRCSFKVTREQLDYFHRSKTLQGKRVDLRTPRLWVYGS